MNRAGLLIALALAAVTGLVFGLYPAFDLKLSAPWFDAAHHGFWARVHPAWLWARSAATWMVTAIALPAFLALAWKLVLPRRRMLMPGRAVLFLIVTLALAPGMVANVILKDNWSRPRPIDVAEYGGEEHFVPWWDPRGDCPKNCSFVAGEPSGAFWTMAPAALAPPHWRPLAYGAAIAFGVGVGLIRLAGGGHFVSDIVFAGVFTFLLIWCVHGLIYRWRTRITDAQIEGVIERLAMPGHDLLVRLFARLRGAGTPR